MKSLFGLILSLILGLTANAQAKNIPHFDLEMSSQELQAVLDARRQISGLIGPQSRLDVILALGKRNLDWLIFINNHRTNKLSLSSKATQMGYPIEGAKEYNESTVYKEYTDLLQVLPGSMKSVLVDQAPFTADPGLPDDQYIAWGLKVDRVYQNAARWLTMAPYLSELAQRKQYDVRGYYFLTRDTQRDQRLANFNVLPADVRQQYTEWLTEMCMNNGSSEGACGSEVKQSIQQGTLPTLYKNYLPAAADNWNSFFAIGGHFDAIDWSPNRPGITNIPFTQVGTPDERAFLKDNIEDEWKWNGWQLFVNFTNSVAGSVNVHWQPGITPHVTGLGSTEVYMDSNAPLTEYDAQWTIRHEFGHVLAFPDCYLEFYDTPRKIIVSYQLDITDLMCSRRGHFQERHYKELKRVYLH